MELIIDDRQDKLSVSEELIEKIKDITISPSDSSSNSISKSSLNIGKDNTSVALSIPLNCLFNSCISLLSTKDKLTS